MVPAQANRGPLHTGHKLSSNGRELWIHGDRSVQRNGSAVGQPDHCIQYVVSHDSAGLLGFFEDRAMRGVLESVEALDRACSRWR
jgi:hypothetical protein